MGGLEVHNFDQSAGATLLKSPGHPADWFNNIRINALLRAFKPKTERDCPPADGPPLRSYFHPDLRIPLKSPVQRAKEAGQSLEAVGHRGEALPCRDPRRQPARPEALLEVAHRQPGVLRGLLEREQRTTNGSGPKSAA